MVIESQDAVPFIEWLPWAALEWLLIVAAAAVIVTVFGWLVSVLRHGPVAATKNTGRVLYNAAIDMAYLSPQRVLALAQLAVKESIRRRVVAVFAVFILLLLFAGWFLDSTNIDPARMYLNFVLTATSYLVLLLAMFLSSLSIPADIKNRTLHTVVTKPVRASEVVLGRIVGFAAVGTILLVVMGAISYLFVIRGLEHTHELTADDLGPMERTAAGQPAELQGLTSMVHQHRHKVVVSSSGRARVELEQRHRHSLSDKVQKGGDQTVYQTGPEEGMLVARVPVYGKLTFLDDEGNPTDKGINVGDEYMYRSFVRGGTNATAIWTFHGITEEAFPKGLPIEMMIEVFRTYKGDIEKGVPGTLSVKNPKTGKKVEVRTFESKEGVIDLQDVPKEFKTPQGESIDLYKDIVSDGEVEVRLQCAAPSQNFGMAQADLYLRSRNDSFEWNFFKGYLGIWLQMLLVIALGVMFSTFLSGSVAMIATLGALIGGFFNDFMFRLATHQTLGGGPFESIGRILSQQGITSESDTGLATTVAQALDQVAEVGLWMMASVLPDFGRFSFSEYVASGYSIPGDTIMTYTLRTFAFVLPVFVAGYLCLKNREIAQQ